MDRHQALKLLGLSEACSAAEIDAAIAEKREALSIRMDAAPTDALRTKYKQMQAKLEAAQSLLSSPQKRPASSSPLSATKIADLPGASPSYTEGVGGGVNVGASIGIQPGHVLMNRYEIKEQIGEGGMGAVYRAFDKTRSSDIAIKVLLPGLLSNEQAKERFLNEARVSSELSHPNIVNVFDVQVDGAFHFITMEILEGQTLRDVMEARKLARQNFSMEEVQETLQPVMDALSYAHKKTVHRDIKPENIFLTEDGDIKLMDFGIARMMRSSQMTQTGAAMGTAYYMAPEQLKGAKDIDGRADQYALGVMVYEMLTGDVPAGMIEPLHTMRKDITKGFSHAITQALSPKPDNRFADMAAFSTGLNAKGVGVILPSGTGKVLGIFAGLAALGVALFLLFSSGVMNDLLPESQESIAAKEQAEQQLYMQAVQLEGEVKELATRLDNAERSQKDEVRSAEGMVRQLEGSLRMARDNRSALQTELNSVRSELTHQQAVERLMNRAVFESSQYTELKGKKNLAEAMNRDKKYKGSIPIFKEIKASYDDLLTAVESASPLELSQSKVKALKKAWDAWASSNQFTGNQADTDISAAYQQASSASDQGDLYAALAQFRKLEDSYQSLQSIAPSVLKNRSLAQQAKATWETYADAHHLSGLKQVTEADASYHAAEQAYQSGKLQDSNTGYVALSKDYAGILEAVENAETIVGKAKEAKQRWEKLVKSHGLASKDEGLKAAYAKAAELRRAGDPIGASLNDLKAQKGYDVLSDGYEKAEKAYQSLNKINTRLIKHSKHLGTKVGDAPMQIAHALKAAKADIQASNFNQALANLAQGKAASSNLLSAIHFEDGTYSLTIQSEPNDAHIRILNIKATYKAGMWLKPGRYHVAVNRSGYDSKQLWVTLGEDDLSKVVRLAKIEDLHTPTRSLGRRTIAGIEMSIIPEGRFRMGSNYGDENPVHTVHINSFKMGKYEVTQSQWQAVMGRNPSRFKRANRPVENVIWDDIQVYLRKLNSATGQHFRLPTEAEWEYAARAGSDTKYSWGNSIGSNRANCDGCGSQWDSDKTAPVGSFSPNGFGLYDMHGNVWEWVQDVYHDSYNGAPSDGSARGGSGERVLRGGSWFVGPYSLRSANRNWSAAYVRSDDIGFRLVQD